MVDSTKYGMLLRILDAIRVEAVGTKWETQYANGTGDIDALQQARSKAFIHLYLKVMFGLSDFGEREGCVTDGSHDGGIDGYYIDQENRRIYLLQSKFRNSAHNFESKKLEVEELLVMDIDRITGGYKENADGLKYNGKIEGLIRKISEISDIARYNYQIAIIANCSLPAEHLRKLTEGHAATVFNFERSYNELVFPIVAGTYFRAQDVTIQLDLSHKSAGAKTSYSVGTPDYECEITVLFVPTLEIAKAMAKYRNTILEYNPRSYLELEGQKVNGSIRETLLRPDSNEFALMNNGITILSDETNLNERIGLHNKAQLRLLNPQIINGGQTAYTLSRTYNEDRSGADGRFLGKEVLTKIITLTRKDPTRDTSVERLRLIDEISAASNRQTPVITADRVSNDSMYIALQRVLFEKYGLLFERKRGEFSDGVFSGYIDRDQVLERNLFLRVLYASQGKLNAAKRRKIFVDNKATFAELSDDAALANFVDGYRLFVKLAPRNTNQPKKYRDVLAKVFIGVAMTDKNASIEIRLAETERFWMELLHLIARHRVSYGSRVFERATGERREVFAPEKWLNSAEFERDVRQFVSTGDIQRDPGTERPHPIIDLVLGGGSIGEQIDKTAT